MFLKLAVDIGPFRTQFILMWFYNQLYLHIFDSLKKCKELYYLRGSFLFENVLSIL